MRTAILNREFTDFGGDAAVDAEPWYYTDTEGGDVGKISVGRK